MSAIIVPFETRAQREERLHRELRAAYEAYAALPRATTFDVVMQALNRIVTFQMKVRRPEDASTELTEAAGPR